MYKTTVGIMLIFIYSTLDIFTMKSLGMYMTSERTQDISSLLSHTVPHKLITLVVIATVPSLSLPGFYSYLPLV